MQSSLIVKKTSDSNFVPVKYRVIEMTVGGTAGATNCALVIIRPGFDTEANYDKWKNNRDIVGRVGAVGDLSVDTLDNLEVYGAAENWFSRDQ